MSGKTRLEGENIPVALGILHDVTTLLEKRNIPYWLEGGTLLGVIRENRLLPWDNDMDISMDREYRGKLLRAAFVLMFSGYRVSIKRYSKSIGPFRKGDLRMIKVRNYEFPLKKGKIMLDIFLKKKKDSSFYWTVGEKNPVLKSVPAHYYENLTQVKFDRKLYRVPGDYEGYLTCRYGDWKTPVKTWDFKKDDQAIVGPSS